jgi:hypothetical protein
MPAGATENRLGGLAGSDSANVAQPLLELALPPAQCLPRADAISADTIPVASGLRCPGCCVGPADLILPGRTFKLMGWPAGWASGLHWTGNGHCRAHRYHTAGE